MKMKNLGLILACLVGLSTVAPDAHAASKKKVTVATLAATYTCLYMGFSSANIDDIKLTLVVAKSGTVTGTGTISQTEAGCDVVERNDCTTTRNISFKLPKLAAPKKKVIYDQSSLKKTTIDAVTGLTISGVVRTFTGTTTRFREINGTASLGASRGSLATGLACLAPETTK
jgi:hypothetical protein